MAFIGRELYKTRLCKLYLRGHCHRDTCTFAHGRADLRPSDRRDYRDGDLRERLERRSSPHKRLSPGRDVRGRHGYANRRSSPKERGDRSRSRSPIRGISSRSVSPASDHRETKRSSKLDISDVHLSDVSEEDAGELGLGLDERPERLLDSVSPSPRPLMEDELNRVNAAINKLNDQRKQLESSLEKKLCELNRLSSQNLELESKVAREQEEYNRISSKTRKFVKLHMRLMRAEEEVKKTRARMQKLVEESQQSDGFRAVITHGDNSDVNILSDTEPEQLKHIARDCGANEAAIATNLPQDDSNIEGNATLKTEIVQRKALALQERIEDAIESVYDDHHVKVKPSRRVLSEANEKNGSSRKISTETLEDHSQLNKMTQEKATKRDHGAYIPSTGLAANADDEILESLDNVVILNTTRLNSISIPKISSKPEIDKINLKLVRQDLPNMAISPSSRYEQYKGEDEEVDVEAVDDGLAI